MKLISFIIVSLFATVSCLISSQKENNERPKQTIPKYIDKNAVSKIQLVIADTSIIDLPSKQLTKLIDVGDAQSFVDSSGNPLYKPSQTMVFLDSDKDSLVNIFNSFLDSLQYSDTMLTTCITLYNHVFLLYDNKNDIAEQIDFAFDCPVQFNYLHRGKHIKVEDENSELILKLIDRLIKAKAYIPVFGPPPSPK